MSSGRVITTSICGMANSTRAGAGAGHSRCRAAWRAGHIRSSRPRALYRCSGREPMAGSGGWCARSGRPGRRRRTWAWPRWADHRAQCSCQAAKRTFSGAERSRTQSGLRRSPLISASTVREISAVRSSAYRGRCWPPGPRPCSSAVRAVSYGSWPGSGAAGAALGEWRLLAASDRRHSLPAAAWARPCRCSGPAGARGSGRPGSPRPAGSGQWISVPLCLARHGEDVRPSGFNDQTRRVGPVSPSVAYPCGCLLSGDLAGAGPPAVSPRWRGGVSWRQGFPDPRGRFPYCCTCSGQLKPSVELGI